MPVLTLMNALLAYKLHVVLEVSVSIQKEDINVCAKMDMCCHQMVIVVLICEKNHATWKNHRINVKNRWQGKIFDKHDPQMLDIMYMYSL